MLNVMRNLRVRTLPLAIGVAVLLFAPIVRAAIDPVCAVPSAGPVPAQCRGVSAQLSLPLPAPQVPGDIAWYKSNFPAPTAVKTAPLPTYNFSTVGPNTTAIFAMAFNLNADTLYAVSNDAPQSLGTINLTTGAFQVIGPLTGIPAGYTVAGLAFDATATPPNNVYFTATNGVTALLWNINVATGALTNQKTITGFPLTIDIAIDRTGQMYGHDIISDVLIRIDKTTGATTNVGPTGLAANFAQGMMYDHSADTLYGCVFVNSPTQGGELVSFNKTTGAATVLTALVPDEYECSVRVPAVTLTPVSLAVDAAGNRVLDPAEVATVAPSWRNDSGPTTVTGTLSNFTGLAGGTYVIVDGVANYGTIPTGGTISCQSTGDCYSLFVSATVRPALHWDSLVDETLSNGKVKNWRLHIGGSFTDVAPTSPFYRFIETIFHNGVTAGCGPNIYCPTESSTREQMAVFALVSKEGPGYTPPACAPPNLFSDVPETSPFCRWIEQLAERGVVAGCGPNLYCPSSPVTREQMAVFALRTLDPVLNPPACVAGSEMFTDVPAASPFCRWVEELARRGVVAGCGGGNYCPSDPVTREQMSVFLSATFGLTLYAP